MSNHERKPASLLPCEKYQDYIVNGLAPLIYAIPPHKLIGVIGYRSAFNGNNPSNSNRPNNKDGQPRDIDIIVLTGDHLRPEEFRLPEGWKTDSSIRSESRGCFRLVKPTQDKPPLDVWVWPGDEFVYHTRGLRPSCRPTVLEDGVETTIAHIAVSAATGGWLIYEANPKSFYIS